MPLNLTIKPAQTELIAYPGTTITQAYNIINNSESSLILTTEVLPFAPINDDGSVTYDNVSPNSNFVFSLANADLTLGQSFILKPKENRQLVLKIKSNSATPLADSYFTFFVSQDLSNSLTGDGNITSATARLGSHLLLSTSKVESPSSTFSITNFAITPKIKDIFYPILNFNGKIYNDSDYFNKPVGKIVVTKNNLTLRELEIFPQNVLAHSARKFQCLSNNEPVPCTLQPPFWPGSYTATLTVADKSSTVTFFVFPYSVVLFLILLASFIWFLLRRQTKQV